MPRPNNSSLIFSIRGFPGLARPEVTDLAFSRKLQRHDFEPSELQDAVFLRHVVELSRSKNFCHGGFDALISLLQV